MQSYRVQAQKGCGIWYDVNDNKIEAKCLDSFTCFHCGRVVFVKPRCDPADMGGFCRVCAKLVCQDCNAKGRCDPWEEQMQRMEAKYNFRKDAGLVE